MEFLNLNNYLESLTLAPGEPSFLWSFTALSLFILCANERERKQEFHRKMWKCVIVENRCLYEKG